MSGILPLELVGSLLIVGLWDPDPAQRDPKKGMPPVGCINNARMNTGIIDMWESGMLRADERHGMWPTLDNDKELLLIGRAKLTPKGIRNLSPGQKNRIRKTTVMR